MIKFEWKNEFEIFDYGNVVSNDISYNAIDVERFE